MQSWQILDIASVKWCHHHANLFNAAKHTTLKYFPEATMRLFSIVALLLTAAPAVLSQEDQADGVWYVQTSTLSFSAESIRF